MLAHVLAGTFDIVIIHYFLLQAELVDLLPWSSPQECQLWANTLYPFLEVLTVIHIKLWNYMSTTIPVILACFIATLG